MRSFLLKVKKPILKWGKIPEETYFEGEIPQGFSLAVSPHAPYIVLDVDRHGDIDGFDNVPKEFYKEMNATYSYGTKNNGKHFWLKYSGDKQLMNKASGLGIDLRSSKGYVVFYPALEGKGDIRDHIYKIKETSEQLNIFLESLFC